MPTGTLFPLILALGAATFLGLRFHPQADHVASCLATFLAEVVAVGLLARLPFAWLGSKDPQGEAARWAILLSAALALTLPYARSARVGAGDAQDYAQHIADFIEQTHHGVFPVLVGQSEFASNGAFNPLRTAPFLQYASGALHALTLGTLGPFAIQNLAIVLSLCAGGFSCYACLRHLSSGREWLCLVLALLYISSPGVLALAYGGDMVPSWLTLPFLPIYTCLLVRIADDGISGPRLLSMAAVVALVWYIHAPIAMWISFIAIPVIIVRLTTAPRAALPRGLLLAAGALTAFVVLAGFEFVSVAELHLPPLTASQLSNFRGPNMYYHLLLGWTGLFRPVSKSGSSLISDLQLSAPLWACVLMGAVAWGKRRWGLRVLLIATGCLFLLLVPLSAAAGLAWSLAPSWVDEITDQWPMQRFYPILSAFAPVAGLLALGGAGPKGTWPQRSAVLALALGCAWCAYEARSFLGRGFRVTLPPDMSRRFMMKENAVSAIYSVGMLGDPPASFSFRPLSAEMQLRLLDDAGRVQQSNLKSLLDGESGVRQPQAPQFVLKGEGQEAELESPLLLPLAGNSLLALDFNGPPPNGTLLVTGKDVWKEYPLPESARQASGGPAPVSTLAITVDDAAGESLEMRFARADGSKRLVEFAHLSVASYDPEILPLHIIGHSPLRVRARAIATSWLETPRIFIAGYRAMVDGKPAEIGRSSNGLVTVRVPAGESIVQLDYPGSLLLRTSFWCSFAGWILFPILFTAWAHFKKSNKSVA